MKVLITILSICFLVCQGQAQSIERQVISSYGLLTSTTSATVGEVITETKRVGSFVLNQGFQQTEKAIETSITDRKFTIDYSLYPNPSTDFITLELNTEEKLILNLYLVNNLGQVVSETRTAEFSNKMESTWSTNTLAAGAYFLMIEDENSKQTNNIPFVKN